MTMQQTFSKWSNIVDAKCSEANFEVNTTFAGVKMKFRIFAHLLILILVCIIAQQKNNRNERGRVRGQVREGDWEGVTNGKRERERIKCMDLPDASWIYLYTLIYINTISPARPAAKWMSVWFLFLWLSLSLSPSLLFGLVLFDRLTNLCSSPIYAVIQSFKHPSTRLSFCF